MKASVVPDPPEGRTIKFVRPLQAALIVTLVTSATVVVTPPQAVAAPEGVTVVRTGDETYLEAIERIAAEDPEFAAEVEPLAELWESVIADGQSVPGISDGSSRSVTTAQLRALSEGKATAQDVVPTDPNTFPVRGNAAGDQSYWTGMEAVVAAAYCGGSAGEETDRITATATVNPGTATSFVPVSMRYFPNTGKLTDWRVRVFAVCEGRTCGSTKKEQPKTTGRTDYHVSSDNDRHGNVLTVAIGLEGYAGNWAYDGMKTKDCKGSADGSDNRCWYDWNKA